MGLKKKQREDEMFKESKRERETEQNIIKEKVE